MVQKWGSASVTLSYSNYFHDWSKNNLSLYSNINVRIIKGLSVNWWISTSLVHDQLNLVKKGMSSEDILLRRKAMATQYYYYTILVSLILLVQYIIMLSIPGSVNENNQENDFLHKQ